MSDDATRSHAACNWCATWTPTPENPCAYCGRDGEAHVTPDRAAKPGWQADPREGVYVLVDQEGALFIGADNIVFQSRDHAQRWADGFATTGPFKLTPRFVGFLRPEGWNFNAR